MNSTTAASKDKQTDSLEDVLDDLEDAPEGTEVSLNDVLERFQGRSLGVWLSVFGLIAALPLIGAIPGVSIVVSGLILLAIFQTLINGGHMSVPSSLGKRAVEEETLSKAVKKARPWVRRVDKLLKARLELLTTGPGRTEVIAVAAALLAVSMVPLAVVPWGVQAPATGILAFGLALIARDGLMALFGISLSLLTIWIAVSLL